MDPTVRTVRSQTAPRDRDPVIRGAALSRDAPRAPASIMDEAPLKGTAEVPVREMVPPPITAAVLDKGTDPRQEMAVPAVRAAPVNLPAVPASI